MNILTWLKPSSSGAAVVDEESLAASTETEAPPQTVGAQENEVDSQNEQQVVQEEEIPHRGHQSLNHDIWEEIPLSRSSSVHEHGRKCTGIVEAQMKVVMGNKFKTKAEKKFKEGEFWTFPPKQSTSDIHNCWQDFFQMKVFNWFPDSRMPRDWRLTCPNCGHFCKKNGQNNAPRLIYGAFENYILNAPQRYLCSHCQRIASEESRRGIVVGDRTRYTFLSTDTEVLAQIEEENPSLMLEFPCHLSAINGIDRELMDMVIFNATRSIGPSAYARGILSFHERRWNEKEIKWLSHVKNRMRQPSATDRRYNAQLVDRCPSYLSEEMCGSTPSSKYLVLMFNRYVTARRQYYDSEVLKRVRMTCILSLDASFKIGKLIMNYGKDNKMYNTLHTMMNEYGHVVGQKWSNGDSHDELMGNLKELQSLGLNPEITFTDNPERDRHMLLNVFPTLKSEVNEIGFVEGREDAAACGQSILSTRGNYLYLYTATSAVAALLQLMENLDSSDITTRNKLVSVDAGKTKTVC